MVAHDADLRVWLATPDAAERLDVARLGPEDAVRWRAIRTARRRLDWASSRALLDAVPASAPCSRSLSHSHGFAALVLAHPALKLGIDVEVMTARDFRRMAEVAFTVDEARYLASLDRVTLAGQFYDLWTLKEAFAKALAIPLTEAMAFWHREMRWEQVAMLVTLILALAATRVITVRFSPRRLQQEL